MRTFLVAGGAGFVGSHLCGRLLADGHSVVCLDDFSTGDQRNLSPFQGHPRFQLLRHDLLDPLPPGLRPDVICNLACPASPPQYQRVPIRVFRISIEGSLRLLELARSSGATILQASTSEVYGDPDIHPQPESYWGNVNPVGLRSCYDEGKRGAETLFFDYYRQHGVKIKVVRIFNTYGPNMQPDDGRVVSNFIVQALRGEPLTLYGDGSQTRSFQYVDDLVRGFLLMLETPAEVTGPVNLGNPGEFTMRELAGLVLELTGSASPLVFRPLPADDPRRRQPDIALARKLLGWSPEVPLRDGLARTIEYFRGRLQA